MMRKKGLFLLIPLAILAFVVAVFFLCTRSKEPYLSVQVISDDFCDTTVMYVESPGEVSKNIGETAVAEYTSQTRLSVYDRKNGVVYYSASVDGCEQLFSYDVKSKETAQLTTDIYGINYICPVDGAVYMIAAMQGTHHLTLAKYELSTEKLLVFDADGTWNFDLMTYDVFNDRLFAAACSIDELDAALGKEGKYIAPDYTVFEFTDDFFDPMQIMQTDGMLVRRMAAMPDGGLFMTLADSIPAWKPEYFSCILDTDTKELTPTYDIDKDMYVSEYIYFLTDSATVYFVGADRNEDNGARRIYRCSLDSGEVELVTSADNGYIDSCCLLCQ